MLEQLRKSETDQMTSDREVVTRIALLLAEGLSFESALGQVGDSSGDFLSRLHRLGKKVPALEQLVAKLVEAQSHSDTLSEESGVLSEHADLTREQSELSERHGAEFEKLRSRQRSEQAELTSRVEQNEKLRRQIATARDNLLRIVGRHADPEESILEDRIYRLHRKTLLIDKIPASERQEAAAEMQRLDQQLTDHKLQRASEVLLDRFFNPEVVK